METMQTTLPVAEQEALHGTSTPRCSRVSSIFQQKTIKQDDIDADFLKHVAFAALRGSPTPSTNEGHSRCQHADQTAIDNGAVSVAFPAAVQLTDTKSAPLADMQPADPNEFTLAKIEQSIAEIEAELGWTSDSAAVTAAASTTDVAKSPAAPPSILSSSHTSRPHATSISSTGMLSATPPQGKRLSFLGELVVPEPSRASAQHPSLVLGGAESGSKATPRSIADVAAADSGVALAEPRSTATADSTVPDNATGSVQTLKALPTFHAEDCQLLSDSPSEANLAGQPLQGSTSKLQSINIEAGMSQSLEGNASKQQLTSLNASPSHSLENSASKRQLTSMHSMQSETMHDGSRRRMIKHSLSGKITTSSAASASNSTYSSRYATRQLSGKASPASTDGALSPRRSLLASPAASVHGGLPATLQHPGKPGSSKPASDSKGDDSSRATLTGAAAVLKSHASSIDGAGWHLATGDGLPFLPRGSLVASSGGSRTLRPIASQQEALFDAEGNMLPRSEWHPSQPEPAVQTDSKAGQSVLGNVARAEPQIEDKQKLHSQAAAHASPGLDSKAASTSADTAAAAGLPAEQKPPAKHSMLSMVMFPCFCLRPRTTSADNPYPQGSLRQRFAAKEAAAVAGPQPGLGTGGAAPRSALKQKQSNENVASDMGASDWDLGTEVHRAGAADAADVHLSEEEVQEAGAEGGRSLQGAISLAPKRSGLATQQPQQATLQQVSEGHAPDIVVSPAASLVSVGASVPGNELGSQYASADAPGAESQPQSLTQSLSHSQDVEAVMAPAASPAATNAAAAADVYDGEDVEGAVAADQQALEWANGTGSSALGRTGGSVSSKTGTRRRKEWEGPEAASPAEVSQSLEDIMLQRFPELEPLLLQTSFTNKQAPWRGPKSGHTSHAPSRGHSLGVSREASFAQSRPESRQGRLPTSQLGVPRAIPGLPWEQAQLAAMQAEPATDLSLYMQSDRQSDVQPEEAAGMHTYSQSGMQTRQPAGSNNCPDMQSEQAAVSTGISLPSSLGQQGDGQHVHTAEDCNSSTMSLVEAAALAASSPGAVVRVPTSTTLSQADQIALRYQHQVQFQLQQALGSSAGLTPTPTARSGSKSPTRRSPTKHRPFHLSDSPWKRDSAQLGQSGKVPSAPAPATSQAASQAASPRRGRSASKSPVRTARSLKAPASPEKQQPTSSKGRLKGAAGSTEPKRQAERQSSSPAVNGQGGVAGWGNPGVMSFGSYGGVAFSSFTPELPAGSPDMVDEEEDDWADDSGKWGELTAPKSSALPVAPPQPKHSSISLADIARDAAGTRAADGRPDPSHSVGAQRGVESGPMGDGQDAASRSYLSLLESLAQEGEFGSPGNSDNDSSPTTTQVHVVEQAWKADNLPSMGPQHPSPRDSYKPAAAEQSSQLSEASSTFGDAAVDGLLPHEASQTHTDNAEGWGCHEASDIHMHVNAHSGGLQESDPGAAGDVQQAGRYLAEEEDQPSSLALALAALAATAAQKHAAQTDMQQLQPDAADSMKPQKADTDLDRQASVSSDSDCDVLAVAAAAAAAAGLSRRQEENPPNDEQAAQLWAVPASAPAPAVEAQAGPHEPLQDAKAGSSHLEFQNDDAQQAQQVGARQRDSASGDYVGPGSSGPSWSAAADGDSGGIGDGIGLFRDKQAVNYVGKSARRPKVATPKPKAGGLHGLFSKLRRGGSKEEEELDSSQPASIAAPRPLDSQAEPSPITKSGSWIPKAFSRSQPESDVGSVGSSSPLQGHTRFADQPLLTGQVAQPDRQDRQPLLGPLPSSKAPQETFTALPSLPVPAPITAPTLTRLQVSKSNMHTGDPVLAPLASPGAGKGAVAAVVGEVQPGSSRVTFSEASSSLLLQQQDTTLQSVSGSDSDDDVSEMYAE